MRLLIGTPAYGGMMHSDYVNSLLEYQTAGIEFGLATIGNESLITRARNSIISYFYEHQEKFTHLLFLDADIKLPAAGLKTLIDFDKDIVGAAVPLKGYWKDGKPKYNIGGFGEKVADHLFKTNRIGTGVMLLSKKAVADLVGKAAEEGATYSNNASYDNNDTITNMTMYDVFQVGVVDGEYLSEDYWVCRTLKTLGYEIHVADSVIVTHHGMHGFTPQLSKSAPNT